MKRFVCIMSITLSFLTSSHLSYSQAAEAQQLLLNIEKLAQFKAILNQLYNSYKVLETGYNKVKDFTSGNFKLHQVFLDGLYLVNPEIRKYYRIPEIISDQLKIVKSYKNFISMYKPSVLFRTDEITYMSKVFASLLEESISNLDELILVITSSKLRMSDEERLSRIDKVHKTMRSKVEFIKTFNQENKILALQRWKLKVELQSMEKLYKE